MPGRILAARVHAQHLRCGHGTAHNHRTGCRIILARPRSENAEFATTGDANPLEWWQPEDRRANNQARSDEHRKPDSGRIGPMGIKVVGSPSRIPGQPALIGHPALWPGGSLLALSAPVQGGSCGRRFGNRSRKKRGSHKVLSKGGNVPGLPLSTYLVGSLFRSGPSLLPILDTKSKGPRSCE